MENKKQFRVYIGEPIPNLRPLLILKRHLGLPDYKGAKPFRAVYGAMDFGFLALEKDTAKADFFLLPHSFSVGMSRNTAYVSHLSALAGTHGKKLVIFAEGDSTTPIVVPHALVFRTSQYAYNKRQNEIIMPPQVYAEDVLDEAAFTTRPKGEKPVVSFCGWSALGTVREKAKFFARNAYADFRTHVLRDPHAAVKKQGIYFRQKAIVALKQSSLVETSFIERDFFSVNKHTIKLPREVLRAEYLKNIQDSDFVLAPKGDGNFSIRFYEALALGRFPVLVDTDCVLPDEENLPYENHIVRVPYREIARLGRFVARFYERFTPDSYAEAQVAARAFFQNELRLDVFLKKSFAKLF